MNSSFEVDTDTLDPEWIRLVLAARDIGISLDEIRKFLKETATK